MPNGFKTDQQHTTTPCFHDFNLRYHQFILTQKNAERRVKVQADKEPKKVIDYRHILTYSMNLQITPINVKKNPRQSP
ncbi:hypothetical protein SAMN04488023_11480 [Pedobacter rhizosphaerae]|uniref:Uncharacterized protein n=1 Tax=Pedobacter rhizosphaerae TaxID=390241 RepID=A0A1H9REL8_9SPHI|nr:hypothetical protein SAMN04488023_11480 [Pedobacter rhizosphaerae]